MGARGRGDTHVLFIIIRIIPQTVECDGLCACMCVYVCDSDLRLTKKKKKKDGLSVGPLPLCFGISVIRTVWKHCISNTKGESI